MQREMQLIERGYGKPESFDDVSVYLIVEGRAAE